MRDLIRALKNLNEVLKALVEVISELNNRL